MYAAIITVVGATIVSLAITIITNTFSPDGGQVGFIRSPVSWIWLLFIAPILAGYYLWGSGVAREIIASLYSSEVVDIFESEITAVSNPYQHPWRMILSIFGGLSLGIYFYITRPLVDAWSSSGILPRVVTSSGMVVGGYMTTMLGLTMLLNVWMIRKLLQNKKFSMRPLHPDQCGGLGFLSSYSLKTVYLAAAGGLAIGTTVYRFVVVDVPLEYGLIFLSIPVYLLWTVWSFVAPLYTAHQGMLAARDEKLDDIAEKFQATYAEVGHTLSNGSDELAEGIGRIKHLEDYYETTRKFPIWPLNVTAMRRFFLSITAPFIPAIVSLIIQVISNLVAN
jgi:hypothetical protein